MCTFRKKDQIENWERSHKISLGQNENNFSGKIEILGPRSYFEGKNFKENIFEDITVVQNHSRVNKWSI